MRIVSCLAVCLCVLIASCVSPDPNTAQSTTVQTTPDPNTVQSAQDTVDAITAVQPAGIPDHFVPDEPADITRTAGDFDVNSYFGVLNHLSMEPGYVLDYLYVYDGMGGYPFIYARPLDKPPYASRDQYVADVADSAQDPADNAGYYDEYLAHVQADDTREGYLEFVALQIMAPQFYLFWHAGYNDATIVCDEDSLDSALSAADASFEGDLLPHSLWEEADDLDLEPTVEFPDDATAVVRLVTFSKWGGFVELRYTVSRQFPHSIIEADAKTLVEYDCGVSF